MAIDRWFFGGGAEHTPEAARRTLYASTSGAEGVGKSSDLKVVPLETPGQGVRVLIGSGLIKSNYIGGETQTYMGTVYEQEIVGTTPTGSSPSTGRSDLVVMRVEDPYAAGSPYTAPAEGDRALAPYIYIRVISGVPSGTTKLQDVAGYQNDTALTLARIDFPASTGTVTSGMIVDLRNVAQPQRAFEQRSVNLSDSQRLDSMSHPGQTFPQEFTDVTQRVPIPEWATHMRLTMIWGSVKMPAGSNAGGRYYIQVGQNTHPDVVRTKTGYFDGDGATNLQTDTWVIGDTREIPESMRGTSEYFFGRAYLENSPTAAQRPYLNTTSSVILNIDFYEQT